MELIRSFARQPGMASPSQSQDRSSISIRTSGDLHPSLNSDNDLPDAVWPETQPIRLSLTISTYANESGCR